MNTYLYRHHVNIRTLRRFWYRFKASRWALIINMVLFTIALALFFLTGFKDPPQYTKPVDIQNHVVVIQK